MGKQSVTFHIDKVLGTACTSAISTSATALKLSVHAEDAAGNVEKRPPGLMICWPALSIAADNPAGEDAAAQLRSLDGNVFPRVGDAKERAQMPQLPRGRPRQSVPL